MDEYVKKDEVIKLIREDKVKITPDLLTIAMLGAPNGYSAEDCYKAINSTCDRHIEKIRNLPAADAIEELTDRNVGKWIPVTEWLPKTRESILGKKSSKVIVAFRYADGAQGTDTAHTLNGEWVFEDHITVVSRTITHWMLLPEPPKEET